LHGEVLVQLHGKDVRGEVEEGDRAESVELVHVREMVKMQVSTVIQMELLHTVKTVIPSVVTEDAQH